MILNRWRMLNRTSCRYKSRRAGGVAVSELVVVCAVSMSLLCLATIIWPIIVGQSAWPEALLSGSSERSVYRISLDRDGQQMWVFRPREGVDRLNVASGSVEQSQPLFGLEVCAIAHSGDGATTMVCGQDGSVLLFRDGDDVQTSQLDMPHEFAVDAAVSQDGSVALCVSARGTVQGWLRRGHIMQGFSYRISSDQTVLGMKLSRSGRRMCVATVDGTIAFFDAQTGIREDRELVVGNNATTFVCSNDDHLLGAASTSGVISLYDAESLNLLWEARLCLEHSAMLPTAFAISPDARSIVLAFNACNDIFVCATDTCEPVRRLHGHGGIVRTLQFAPNSRMLYSGSYDGTIREWSCDTWRQVRIVD